MFFLLRRFLTSFHCDQGAGRVFCLCLLAQQSRPDDIAFVPGEAFLALTSGFRITIGWLRLIADQLKLVFCARTDDLHAKVLHVLQAVIGLAVDAFAFVPGRRWETKPALSMIALRPPPVVGFMGDKQPGPRFAEGFAYGD